MSESVVVINLDRSTDRWSAFRQANAHVPHERFSACDGRTFARADLARDGIMRGDLAYTDGAVGNALSHITLWRRAMAQARPLTIAEDDAVFNKAFVFWSDKVLRDLAGQYDIIHWGFNFDAVLTYEFLPGISTSSAVFSQASLRQALGRFQNFDFAPSIYRLRAGFGLPCYSLSPEGAERLLAQCLPLAPMRKTFPGCLEPTDNTAIDVAMSVAYPTLRAFVALPPLVVTPNVHETSTVQPPSPLAR